MYDVRLTKHNQEIARMSPDPFPLLRAGSRDETRCTHGIRNVRTELKSAVKSGPPGPIFACEIWTALAKVVRAYKSAAVGK